MRWLPLMSCCLIALLVACGNNDVVTESYATLDEATSAQAIERGWVPRGLPAGSREIREAHDLDSNRRWGLLNFPEAEGTAWRGSLGAEIQVTGMVCHPPRRIEWWPVLLRGTLSDGPLQATGLRAYRTSPDRLIVFVNWAQGRAYYCTEE